MFRIFLVFITFFSFSFSAALDTISRDCSDSSFVRVSFVYTTTNHEPYTVLIGTFSKPFDEAQACQKAKDDLAAGYEDYYSSATSQVDGFTYDDVIRVTLYEVDCSTVFVYSESSTNITYKYTRYRNRSWTGCVAPSLDPSCSTETGHVLIGSDCRCIDSSYVDQQGYCLPVSEDPYDVSCVDNGDGTYTRSFLSVSGDVVNYTNNIVCENQDSGDGGAVSCDSGYVLNFLGDCVRESKCTSDLNDQHVQDLVSECASSLSLPVSSVSVDISCSWSDETGLTFWSSKNCRSSLDQNGTVSILDDNATSSAGEYMPILEEIKNRIDFNETNSLLSDIRDKIDSNVSSLIEDMKNELSDGLNDISSLLDSLDFNTTNLEDSIDDGRDAVVDKLDQILNRMDSNASPFTAMDFMFDGNNTSEEADFDFGFDSGVDVVEQYAVEKLDPFIQKVLDFQEQLEALIKINEISKIDFPSVFITYNSKQIEIFSEQKYQDITKGLLDSFVANFLLLLVMWNTVVMFLREV